MTYRHPSIISNFASTRPTCPACDIPALTGALEPDSRKEGYETYCELCMALVHLTINMKVDAYSLPEFNGGKWVWV
jgi:hypothetical protein